MPIEIQLPETDLLLPLPEGEHWHQHKIHTYYHGFSVPQDNIFVFTYIRAHPAFPLAQGGVCVIEGMDNNDPLDMEHIDYQMTMPWPTVQGRSITTENGLRIDFVEPGRVVRLSYRSADGNTSFDVTQTAVSPLVKRSFIMPGEELFHDLALSHGGSEQFMHAVGELVLKGQRYDVDCYHPRDRSWNQVRLEQEGTIPPTAWSPMYFGPDLMLNATSSESAETQPIWSDVYQPRDEKENVVFGWVYASGDSAARAVVSMRRKVLEHHPRNHMAIRQEIELEDENGQSLRFHGEAVACAVVPQWPNLAYRVALYRWQDERGREAYCDFQEMWYSPFHRDMRRRQLERSAEHPAKAILRQ